jgi:hypothetical protein
MRCIIVAVGAYRVVVINTIRDGGTASTEDDMAGDHELSWWTTDPQAIADVIGNNLLPIEKAWDWTHDGRGALVRVAFNEWPEINVLIRPKDATVTIGGVFGPAGNLRLLQYEAKDPAAAITTPNLRRLPTISTLAAWEKVGREIARQILVEGIAEDQIVIDGRGAAAALDRLTSAVPPRPREHRSRGKERHELIERVATLYRAAVASGDPRPRTSIGRQLGYSTAHIGRLLMDARRPQGDGPPLLGPAVPGKAGETPEP